MTIFIIIILVFVLIRWCIKQHLEIERQEAFSVWAELHNWSYTCQQNHKIYRRYSFLNRLKKGSNRYAKDILRGTWDQYQAEVFNFHYETKTHQILYSLDSSYPYGTGYGTSSYGPMTTTETHHHYIGVALLHIESSESSFPELQIFPQSFLGRIWNAFGFGGIKFESKEFSRNFAVLCKDKNFAHSFCQPKMIDYLLKNPYTWLEVEGNILAIYKIDGKIEPSEIQSFLVKLCDLRQLMPEYLFTEDSRYRESIRTKLLIEEHL
jgi:hypothetical protein